MKNPIFLAIAMTILFGNLFAQAPQAFKYQTVVRNNAGEILANQNISFRMSILQGENSPGDFKSPGEYTVLYAETHLATTNEFGLATLEIGRGTPVTGNFATINWSSTPIFLKTEIDPSGGSAFVEMGTSELLSVPYSLFSGQAGGILSMTNQERNALQNPPVGMQIYNTTTNCLNYFSGSGWYETCGSLVMNLPPEQPSNPGPPDNATDLLLEQTLSWNCSDPENDPLTFDVYFGHNNPPEMIFSGLIDFTYSVHELGHSMLYYWKVVAHDSQGNISEGPVWTFTTVFCAPPQVWAGEDATICSNNPYQIVGANSSSGDFLWTTLGDGTFSEPTVLNPMYTPGVLDVQNGFTKLTLNATEVLPCPPFTSSDEVQLTIIPEPTVNAGPDQTVCYGELVYLEAVASNYFQIQWFTINGCGMFDNEQQLNTIYYPSPACDYGQGCIDIVIYAAPFSPCNINAEDFITVCFEPAPTANAGTDQLDLAGTSTTLQGNTPDFGTGQWSIISGTGGSISSPANPISSFSGQAGTTYILRWTISTACGSSSDDVTISFASSWTCGMSLTVNHVAGDVAPVNKSVTYGTVTNIPGGTSKCWITSNLGADHQAIAASDDSEASAGWYWQFNRKQGHKHDGTTCTPNSPWVNSIIEFSNWTPANDPCALELGAGWRIPTGNEWVAIDQSGNWTNWIDPWDSDLKLHAAGYLENIYSSLMHRGFVGLYWSSNQNYDASGWILYFHSSQSFLDYTNKAYGISLRCLRD